MNDNNANNNGLRTSVPQHSGVSFFDLPMEIRAVIYECALNPNNRPGRSIIHGCIKPSLFSNWADYRRAIHDYNLTDHREDEEQSRELKPSSIALTMTCRQAYQEASHVYYSNARFELDSGYILNRYLKDIQAIHIQSIKRLFLTIQTRPTERDGICHPFSMQENTGPYSLAVLKHFHGLEDLEMLHSFESKPGPARPCKDFIGFLIDHTKGLKQLKAIRIQSFVWPEQLPNFISFRLNFNDIPGWIYSGHPGHTTRAEHSTRFHIIAEQRLTRIHDPS